MKSNVCGIDRLLRIIAGLAILSLFFVLEGGNQWYALFGLVPLLTGIIRFCPVYPILRLSTCGCGK
jgi:hypothetical protein